MSVMVFGDLIRDVSHWCRATRLCPEAPAPVLVCDTVTDTPGGAGLVADQLGALIGKENVRTVFGSRSRKKRIFADGHLICRIDDDSIETDPYLIENYGVNKLTENLPKIVIVSDYDKGAISERGANLLMKACKQAGVPVLVDAKNTWRFYYGAFCFFPNQREMSHKLQAEHIVQKMGDRGSIVDGIETPTSKVETRDCTGAGDVYLAAFAAHLLKLGAPYTKDCLVQCASFANRVAGLSVTHLGTYVVQPEETECFLSA